MAASQPYWEGWYKGLSDMFMSVVIPKVLVLAGTDRLDRVLTVGQMQGKFQLVLLPQVQLSKVAKIRKQSKRIYFCYLQLNTSGSQST